MFFTVAKLFSLFASPSHVGILLLAAGVLALFVRRVRAARWFLLPVLLGSLCALGPVQRLAQPLENWFPARPTLCHIDGIILLGGGEEPKLARLRDQPLLRGNSGKYFEALDLMHRFPDVKLIVAAGNGSWNPQGTHETDVAAALFAEAGIPADRIILESESRDTFENFRNAKSIVTPKPTEHWVLLTSALHMPRSVAIAREVGFPVIAWPTDYLTRPAGLLITQDFGSGLSLLDNVFHEWAGLIAYRLTGRTTSLLPALEPVDGDCAGPA